MTTRDSPPDDQKELAYWVEKQLTGLQLREWVIRLKALRGEMNPLTTSETLALDQVFSPDEMRRLLKQGISSVDDAATRLMVHPSALLELQQRIFLHGGPYWDSLERSPEHERWLTAAIHRDAASGHTLDDGHQTLNLSPNAPGHARRSRPRSNSSVRWMAVAACLVASFVLWRFAFVGQQAPTQLAIPLADPTIRTSKLKDQAFLQLLEKSMEPSWGEITDAELLVSAFDQYTQVCITLADSPLPQLTNTKDGRRIAAALRTCAREITEVRRRISTTQSILDSKDEATQAVHRARDEIANLSATMDARDAAP